MRKDPEAVIEVVTFWENQESTCLYPPHLMTERGSFSGTLCFVVVYIPGRRTKSTISVILSVVHCCQNPFHSILAIYSPSRTNILLSTLFSDSLNLSSSLHIRDKLSHPYRTKGKIIVLHILTFMFSHRRLKDRRLWILNFLLNQFLIG
jgi:hypothetical protein